VRDELFVAAEPGVGDAAPFGRKEG